MQFVDPSPVVAAYVGRVVPSAVKHDRPAHELCSWIVRVAVVVEEVGQCEASRRDGVSVHGALTGKLVLVAFKGLHFIAERKILGDVQPRQIWFWRGGGDARQLAIR